MEFLREMALIVIVPSLDVHLSSLPGSADAAQSGSEAQT